MVSKKPVKRKGNSARKKSASKARRTAPRKKRAGFFGRVVLTALFIMASLGIGAGYYLYTHPESPRLPRTVAKKIIKPLGIEEFSKPDFEIFPIEPVPPKESPPPRFPPDKRPRVAIIIDDLGYDKKLADRFLSIDSEITYAILPKSPFRKEIAAAVHRKGREVMLHLPMEPNEYPEVNPGPGALLSAMTPDERIRVLKDDLDEVPFISGVNNHMGSKVTADSGEMNQIFSVIRQRGLYFIDSRTTGRSLSKSSARLFGVPFAERDVFLDHVITESAIRKQLAHLVRLAERNGQAVGIGHPHRVTFEVLARMLPELKQRVNLIRASDTVRVIGS